MTNQIKTTGADWYKDALIYELHVRAFCDSNGDGIGDFNGLISKLDYLQDLGITAIWLLPFYPSPLRDDGYDIADYTNVNPSYGTLADFKKFLREAHRRDLRVITELVINHTSSEHPWFKRAREAPAGSRLRDFYVWSDTAERYRDARIIFQDFETSNWTWDPVAKAYYWHRFYSHQPDLNFENPDVQEALFRALDFWMGMGVDGLRLDAVPYLFEREGTNCENLPETHAFLKKLRAYIDARYPNRMLLAEANQWPEDAATYFGDGDECHMNFNFPLMPRMFMAVHLENRFPILDILKQTPEIPANCQWATFLRNHDELTLEMVTDEDRDYMWRVYAEDKQARINLGIRRRLAPLLRTRRKIELLMSLLFSLPGTPVLYYGDEIGMGENIYLGDRDGVRTPMQWSPDRNAGFSRANPQKLFLPVVIDPEYHYEAVNVETELENPSSILWWTKRLIAMRQRHPVFGRGTLEILDSDNKKVLAFVRSYEGQQVLVVANLSRYCQPVALDLAKYAGAVPEELFGRVPFPAVRETPYSLTLTPHAFFWFLLTRPSTDAMDHGELPAFGPVKSLAALLAEPESERLEKLLPTWMARQRWFRSKARAIRSVEITEQLEGGDAWSVFVAKVDFYEGLPETYLMPLAISRGKAADAMLELRWGAIVADVSSGEANAVLHDAAFSERFAVDLLALFTRRKSLKGSEGRLVSWMRSKPERGAEGDELAVAPRLGGLEQTNTSIMYGERYMLKLQRVLEAGESSEIEIVRFLNERSAFSHCPQLLGTLAYERTGAAPVACATLQKFIPNQGDAWQVTMEALDRYYDGALAHAGDASAWDHPLGSWVGRIGQPIPEPVAELAGSYASFSALLGRRTAELHAALGAETRDPAFVPEPFSTLHQRSLYQSARARLLQTMEHLRSVLPRLEGDLRLRAERLADREGEIDARLRRIASRKIETLRIRCHGDYHLGQVLVAGNDFVIIDFEGEPARSISERRFKRSPMRDVAGMLRSFHYAAMTALLRRRGGGLDVERLTPWARAWVHQASSAFLREYLAAANDSPALPKAEQDVDDLLDFYLVEKCVYELGYELDNRPEWIGIPMRGLDELLESGRAPGTAAREGQE